MPTRPPDRPAAPERGRLAPTHSPADTPAAPAAEPAGSAPATSPLTDLTNVRLVVVCPLCDAEQASPPGARRCWACGARLGGAQW